LDAPLPAREVCCALALVAVLPVLPLACASAMPPLACADGALPCAEQVQSFQCDTLTEGMLPPDKDELEWMLSGAKIPAYDHPSIDLAGWCSGPLEAAGLSMHVDLFIGVEGGFLDVPGREPVWFEAPLEAADSAQARMCIAGDLPSAESVETATCLRLGKTLELESFQLVYSHAEHADLARFGDPADPRAVCDVHFKNGRRLRADLFNGGKGWLRLPGQKRLCFVPRP
jgi:hypothetical protein